MKLKNKSVFAMTYTSGIVGKSSNAVYWTLGQYGQPRGEQGRSLAPLAY